MTTSRNNTKFISVNEEKQRVLYKHEEIVEGDDLNIYLIAKIGGSILVEIDSLEAAHKTSEFTDEALEKLQLEVNKNIRAKDRVVTLKILEDALAKED